MLQNAERNERRVARLVTSVRKLFMQKSPKQAQASKQPVCTELDEHLRLRQAIYEKALGIRCCGSAPID